MKQAVTFSFENVYCLGPGKREMPVGQITRWWRVLDNRGLLQLLTPSQRHAAQDCSAGPIAAV